MSLDRANEVQKQVQSLLDTGFIREVIYPTWLPNVVMVKKVQWEMANVRRLYPPQQSLP